MNRAQVSVIVKAAIKFVAIVAAVILFVVWADSAVSKENAKRQATVATMAVDQLNDNGVTYQAMKAQGIDNNAFANLIFLCGALVVLSAVGYSAYLGYVTYRKFNAHRG